MILRLGGTNVNLAELFEKAEARQRTTKANNRLKKIKAVVVNEQAVGEHIVAQVKNLEAGVPQRISRQGGIYCAHSVWSCR